MPDEIHERARYGGEFSFWHDLQTPPLIPVLDKETANFLRRGFRYPAARFFVSLTVLRRYSTTLYKLSGR